MGELPDLSHEEIIRRLSRDLADGYDEELEMEFEDQHPLLEGEAAVDDSNLRAYRREYFRQLFRLQAELVKLQD